MSKIIDKSSNAIDVATSILVETELPSSKIKIKYEMSNPNLGFLGTKKKSQTLFQILWDSLPIGSEVDDKDFLYNLELKKIKFQKNGYGISNPEFRYFHSNSVLQYRITEEEFIKISNTRPSKSLLEDQAV